MSLIYFKIILSRKHYRVRMNILSYSRLYTSKERDSSAKPPKDTKSFRILRVQENKSYIFANKSCTYIESSVFTGAFPDNRPPPAKIQSHLHQLIISMTND